MPLKNWPLESAIFFIVFLFPLTPTWAANVDFAVDSCMPAPDLTRMFERTSSWTGDDAAYSVRLAQDKILWLFGDSFMGTISNNRRERFSLIHNSVALQNPNQKKPVDQFLRKKRKA